MTKQPRQLTWRKESSGVETLDVLQHFGVVRKNPDQSWMWLTSFGEAGKSPTERVAKEFCVFHLRGNLEDLEESDALTELDRMDEPTDQDELVFNRGLRKPRK
jgi:hypothetical protein